MTRDGVCNDGLVYVSEEKRRGRIANGASSPPAAAPAPAPGAGAGAGAGPVCASPRRRGRPRLDDTDYFTAFYNRAQESNYNVVVQVHSYLYLLISMIARSHAVTSIL